MRRQFVLCSGKFTRSRRTKPIERPAVAPREKRLGVLPRFLPADWIGST
jgi:hypothetical protein